MVSVLAVVAHPDDEVLCCGGSLALHADRGDAVTIAILGEGMRSRDEFGEDDVVALRAHALEAAGILGVSDVRFAALPDQRFDSLALLDVIKIVEKLVHELDPTVLYTHDAGDLNADHRVTAAAVMTATRPLPAERPRTILAGETLSSSEWTFGLGTPFSPTWFVDIGSVVERKALALEAYSSELREAPHPRSRYGVELAARRWGMTLGVDYAEPFVLLRTGPAGVPA